MNPSTIYRQFYVREPFQLFPSFGDNLQRVEIFKSKVVSYSFISSLQSAPEKGTGAVQNPQTVSRNAKKMRM